MDVREECRGFGYAKALIFGEYAVLHGSPCLVAALSPQMQAHCRCVRGEATDPQSEHIASLLGVSVEACHFEFDHSAFYDASGHKLGIGSSAAMFVAALDAASDKGDAFGDMSDLLTAVAAHRAFQHGLGSGADVIASMLGGLVLVEHCPDAPSIQRVSAQSLLPFAVLASHDAAPTAAFVEAAKAQEKKASYRGIIKKLTEQNRAFAHFILSNAGKMPDDGYRRAFLAQIDGYYPLLMRLQNAIGRTILTETFETVRKLAPKGRVAVKTSGAGGGDIMLVFAMTQDELDAFCREVEAKCPVHRLDVSVAKPRGNAALDDPISETLNAQLRPFADAFEAQAARSVIMTTLCACLVLALGVFIVLICWSFSTQACLLICGCVIFAFLMGKAGLHFQRKHHIDAMTALLAHDGITFWDMKRYLHANVQTYPVAFSLIRQ